VTTKAEQALETMWTSSRLFGHVAQAMSSVSALAIFHLSKTVGGRNHHHVFGEVKAARRSCADAHGLYQQLLWIDRHAAADQSRSRNN
jgi:hypothetical protein